MTAPSLVVQAAEATSRRLAREQHGVLSRQQLRTHGVPRWFIARELRARRWQRTGRQTVVVHNGPLDWRTSCWVALLELDPRAALDGVTALRWYGLPLTDEDVVVITPKGSRRRRLVGVRVRESRRWRGAEVASGSPRCMEPAVAAVHAALWAATDKQAAYLVTLAVQQGVATPTALTQALGAVRRARRRQLLIRVVHDLVGGSRTLGEIDFAAGLRERDLPAPDRQSVRMRPSGVQYLDADFDRYAVTVEMDGTQHELPDQRLSDLLRDLCLVADGRSVIRIPMVAWWLDREAVLDALEQVFASRGWRRAA